MRIEFNRGPIMWRCTDGGANYRTTWWVRCYAYRTHTSYSLPLLPVPVLTPWHRGCLSACEALGTTTHTFTLGIAFWKWNVAAMMGRTDNVKTQAEIDDYDKQHLTE